MISIPAISFVGLMGMGCCHLILPGRTLSLTRPLLSARRSFITDELWLLIIAQDVAVELFSKSSYLFHLYTCAKLCQPHALHFMPSWRQITKRHDSQDSLC
jgi:hypothetical protein